MIGRRKHPRQAMRQVYVPLRRGTPGQAAGSGAWSPPGEVQGRGAWAPAGQAAGRGAWVSLLGPGFRDNIFDAAKVCADDAASRFAEIARRVRVVRALCEHPEMEFFFESLDADMLRDEVRDLEELIRAESENMAHLLELREEDIAPQNGHNGEVAPDALADAHADEHEPWQSADELFAHFLASSLKTVEEVTGDTVSRAGIDDAIAYLRDVQAREGEPDSGPGEASPDQGEESPDQGEESPVQGEESPGQGKEETS